MLKLKLRASRFIRRVGLKNFPLYMLFLLTPVGWILLIRSAQLIFCRQHSLKVVFNPLRIITLSHLLVRGLGSSWLCTSLIKRVQFLAPDPDAVYIYFHIWVAEDYEEFTKPGKGDVAIDVGAHVGLFTLKCLLKHKCALVVAIEPNPVNMRLLYMNTFINGVSERVIPVRAAAGERGGRPKLYIDKYYSGRHSLVLKGNAPALEVDMVTIDDVVAKFKLQKVDFIKIDVEGYELEVIKGAVKTLARFHPTLVIETGQRNLSTLLKLLRNYGYSTKVSPYGSGYHVTAIPRQ